MGSREIPVWEWLWGGEDLVGGVGFYIRLVDVRDGEIWVIKVKK